MSLETTAADPLREKLNIVVDTDHLGPLDASQIENTVQLFANILINAWTEICESEDGGKRGFSFAVSIAGRSIDAKLSGSRRFKYDDEIFIDDPYQPELFGEDAAGDKEEAEEDGELDPTIPLLGDGKGVGQSWSDVLSLDYMSLLDLSREEVEKKVEKAYRKLAKTLHPDTEEGDVERMQELNDARAYGMQWAATRGAGVKADY